MEARSWEGCKSWYGVWVPRTAGSSYFRKVIPSAQLRIEDEGTGVEGRTRQHAQHAVAVVHKAGPSRMQALAAVDVERGKQIGILR